MNAPRVGIVGARRVRQGLGPFVAEHLVAAGAEVAALLGTRPESVREAERELRRRLGRQVPGYTDLGRLLEEQPLDVLAILSPSETHARYLEQALERQLHVLCEKPLLWDLPKLGGRAAALVAGFAEAGLLLRENCQWPFTLKAFAQLHPGVQSEPLRRLGMRLCPISEGPRMIGDALPHPLSLLQALVPGEDARLEGVRFPPHPDPRGMKIRFQYLSGRTAAEVEIELVRSDRTPPEASYGINGQWVERRVRVSDYAIFFVSGGRAVPVKDPVRELVEAFLADLEPVREGLRRPGRSQAIAVRMEMLATILEAYETEGTA